MPKGQWDPQPRINPSGKRVFVAWVPNGTDAKGRVKKQSLGTFARKRDAQDAISAHFNPSSPTPSGLRSTTIGEFQKRWSAAPSARSVRSQRSHESRLRRAFDIDIEGMPLKEWDPRELKRRHVDLLVNALFDSGAAPGGVRGVLSSYAVLIQAAWDDEFCETNVFSRVRIRAGDPRRKKDNREARPWTLAQLHTFATFAPTVQATAQYHVMADCGLRIGEMLALELCDVAPTEALVRETLGQVDGFGPGFLLVRQTAYEGRVLDSNDVKNHKRLVPLPAVTEAKLAAMVRRLHCSWLFPSPRGKLWRAEKWYVTVHQPTIVAANVDRDGERLDPLPGEMRHAYVSLMRGSGIDPADVADAAGHTVETATKVYTHALHESYDRMRRVVDEAETGTSG